MTEEEFIKTNTQNPNSFSKKGFLSTYFFEPIFRLIIHILIPTFFMTTSIYYFEILISYIFSLSEFLNYWTLFRVIFDFFIIKLFFLELGVLNFLTKKLIKNDNRKN